MVSIRKTNTRITGANKTLFNTALPHRLIFRVHSEHYQAGNFIFVVLVGQGWNHVRMMHLAKVIRCGEL